SPGVVAHGAEAHYATASTVVAQLGGLTSLWGGAKAAQAGSGQNARALPPPPPAAAQGSKEKEKDNKGAKSSGGGWGWGSIAMAAGAVGAVAAGGAVAYMKREQITQGLGFATSHLE